MKLWALWFLALLVGCTTWEGEQAGGTAGAVASIEPTPACPVSHYQQVQNPDVKRRTFPDLESLVTFRQKTCQRPAQERDRMLSAYREATSDEALLKTLMLATCEPDQTPGLLANSLVEARDLQHPPPGFSAFLDLLAAEAKSYSLLDRRLRETRKRLEDMIEGIRTIEAEMGESGETSR